MTVTFDELRATEAGNAVLKKMFLGGRRQGTNFNDANRALKAFIKYGNNHNNVYTKRAQHVFNKHADLHPESVRNVDALYENLQGTDWSHYKAHSKGGGTGSWNGEFENSKYNRDRKDRFFSEGERKHARKFLDKKAKLTTQAQFIAKLETALNKAISDAITAAVIGAIIGGAGAFIVNLPKYLKGEITNEEYAWRIIKAATVSGVVSGGIAFVISLITSLIPGGQIIVASMTAYGMTKMVLEFDEIIKQFKAVWDEYVEVFGNNSKNVNKVTKEYADKFKQLSLNIYENIKQEISIYKSIFEPELIYIDMDRIIPEPMRLQPADESRNWRPYRPRPRYY